MNKHTVEFKIGDTVTYCPYKKSFPRIVIAIRPHQNVWGKPDERVWYELSANANEPSICTTATGACIKESIYFTDYKTVELHEG